MRLILLFVFLVSALPIGAVNYETNLKVSWGKRLIDDFDRHWPELRYDTSEVGAAEEVKQLSYLRNVANVNYNFMLSPIYKHFFGLSFAASFSTSDAFLKSKIGTTTHQTALSYFSMSPAISYQFYPAAESRGPAKYFYLGADMGMALATIEMNHQESGGASGTVTELIQFQNIMGLRLQTRLGLKIPIGKGFAWFIEGGVDLTRLDDIEGATNRNGTNQSISLQTGNGELAPVPVGGNANPDDFKDFENTSLWINQVFLGVGLSFAFGEG